MDHFRTLVIVATAVAWAPACLPADGGVEGEGEGEGEGKGEGEAVDFGFVFVTSDPLLGFARASAVFRRAQPRAFDCSEETIDGCVVLRCGDTPLPTTAVDAGDIDITGAAVAIALRFADGPGYNDVDDDALFDGGETLVAVGNGSDAPAFTLQTTAPTAVALTTPVWPAANTSLVVPRSDGLTLRWTGQSAGDVRAIVNSADFAIELTCAFPANAGSGAIPASALSVFDAGEAFVDVDVRAVDDTRIDTWQVQLAATTHATADGEPAIASVTFE